MNFSAGSRVVSRTSLLGKFDKFELSIKSGERIRRAGGVECVDLNEISAEIQISKKLEKFWTSPANNTNVQQRGLSLASSTPVFARQDILLSGSVTDKGIVSAQFLCADGLSVPPSIKTSVLNTLVCNVKETYVIMCDRKCRKCKQHGKRCVLFYHKQEEFSCKNK